MRGREEMRALAHGVFVPCTEGRDVVEDPECAAVRGDDEIVTVNGEIADGADGQIILQRAPGGAVVEGNEDADFGSGEEHAFAHGIFAHGVDVGVVRKASVDFLPGLAVVVGAIDIRMEVVHLMAVNCGVGGGGAEARCFDQADHAPVFYAGRSYVGPVRAFVESEMDETVVRAGPDFTFAHGRRGDGVNHATHLSRPPSFGAAFAAAGLLSVRSGLMACQV